MRRLHLLLAFATLAACAGEQPSATPDVPGADEYAVWSAAVDAQFGALPRRLVLHEETFDFVTADYPGPQRLRQLSGVPRALARDYLARNAHPARVAAGRLHPSSVGILPDPGGAPDTVPAPGSDGRLTLSRVGFDRGGRRALVTVTFTCGSLCGEGAMLVMERDVHGRWRETASVMGINF